MLQGNMAAFQQLPTQLRDLYAFDFQEKVDKNSRPSLLSAPPQANDRSLPSFVFN
jgi:hypothetical protein